MKNIIALSLLFLLTQSVFSQEKINEKEEQVLDLKTLDFELYYGISNNYYDHVFFEAYEYPTIREGYYMVKIFESLDGLIIFYTELSNLSTFEDGKYKLSTKLSSSNSLYKNFNIVAEKKGKKIKLLSSDSKYARVLGKIYLSDVVLDLELIKGLK